jgi:hypothetical protein
MSFGLTAATWVAIGTAAVGAASAAYNADSNRKNLHSQQDALKAAAEEDARKTAEAETNAMVAANAQLADAKRRRRSSSLSTGGGNESLGGGSALLAGAPAIPGSAARATAYGPSATGYAGTVLGQGAPAAQVATRPATRGPVAGKRGDFGYSA